MTTHTPYYIYTRARVLVFLTSLCLFMANPFSARAQLTTILSDADLQFLSAPKHEMRAVWITTLNGLDWPKVKAVNTASMERQKQELRDLLDQLKAININTVLLQTRVRGSVIYPSAIEPWDVALTGTYGKNPGYDPLAFAIQEAHQRGMELHAWIVTIPCFKVAIAKQMGSKSVLKTHPQLCRKHADMYYLDPGLPGTADYLQRICHEIVSHYDVDGIHFDYIRYPENATSFGDAATFKKYGTGKNKAAWRRDNITAIVRRIYNDTKALKPWVRVSSSPVGKYADVSRFSSRGWNARDAVHQDAEGWLKSGIHDILFPMMYFDGNHFYPFAADWQEQSSGRFVAPGLGIYFLHPQEKNWPLSVIQRQLYYLREQGLSGQAYFRSKFLTDNTKGLYDYLRDDFYAYPALTPACTWIDSQAPSRPEAISTTIINDQTEELNWQPSTDNLAASVRYNVYASRQWPVDISRAENLVATALTEPHFRYNRFAALGYYFAITAMDRVGNESEATQVSSQIVANPQLKLRLDNNGHIQDFVHRPLTTVEQQKLKKEKAKKKKRK